MVALTGKMTLKKLKQKKVTMKRLILNIIFSFIGF